MISVELARALRDGGLQWTAAAGDRFVVADRGMDDDIFTLSDMIADVHALGPAKVIGFNGTTEWALDSVEIEHALWLPSETQLRERLGRTFVGLTRSADRWRVELAVSGRSVSFEGASADDAYGRALLHLVTGG